jgi:protein-S-isoprenylcysteine O-methyltransferase Ste14
MRMNRGPKFFILVPMAAIALLLYEYGHSPWNAHRVAGLILMIAALIPLTVARIQLGNSFSLTPQARELVTQGIYSRIRNPIYVFSTFFLIGLFLFLGNPYLFLLFLVILPLQFFRARAEGRVLEEHFGDQYRQYKARTWF